MEEDDDEQDYIEYGPEGSDFERKKKKQKGNGRNKY